MLDLQRLQRIRLSTRPAAQRGVANLILLPNYGLLPGVKIDIEHRERIPDESVIFAMNHTDRFNYFPFQYRLYKEANRFTATWVKGKYYETPWVGMFMEKTNNLPTVSRGYLITRDFLETLRRKPSDAEYAALRHWVDVSAQGVQLPPGEKIPAKILTLPRSMFGRPFHPGHESYAVALNDVFRQMMARFVELHEEAFAKKLDILVFPQGTRSIRLSKGHAGLAQIALRYKKTIVPVGCNGSNRVYPDSSPFARRGHIVYRIGEPIRFSEMKKFWIKESYQPFSVPAEQNFGSQFQGLVDLVMDRINEQLDPEYRYEDGQASGGVEGSDRFI